MTEGIPWNFIVPIITALIAYRSAKVDVTGKTTISKEENKDKVYDGWEKLYKTQQDENIYLRGVIESDRTKNTEHLKNLDDKMTQLEIEFSTFREEAQKREEGLKLEIETLEDDKDVLIEKNEILTQENNSLKQENCELKQEVDNLIKGQLDLTEDDVL